MIGILIVLIWGTIASANWWVQHFTQKDYFSKYLPESYSDKTKILLSRVYLPFILYGLVAGLLFWTWVPLVLVPLLIPVLYFWTKKVDK